MTKPQQIKIPCVYMRGGTSKGVYLMGKDLPPPGHKRDAILMRIMGTPDQNEIDGMGGAQFVTSKIAIIDPPSVPDADIDYTFGQAEILKPHIDYKANCGNISSGVGPFAIDTGLVKAVEPITKVRIYNTNSKKMIYAYVPTVDGKARVQGDYSIAGVPGTGAEIFLDFHDTVGAETDKCLPTGSVTDEIKLSNGKVVEVSVCDAGNLSVIVLADDIGVSCTETKAELDTNVSVFNLVREIRGKVAEKIGLCDDWHKIDDISPMLPMVAAVAKPASDDEDLRVRLFLLNKCHPALAGTGSVCVGACSAIKGSIANRLARIDDINSFTLRIRHPLGIMPVTVESKPVANQLYPNFTKIGYHRTARRIMSGDVYIPNQSYE